MKIAQQVVAHQPAISFSNSFQNHFKRAGGRTSNVVPEMQKRIYQIDGNRFSDLQGFFDQIGEHLIPGTGCGRNLDAFNDILRGGFGTPDEGFILVWLNSAESKKRLGYDETQRQLERRLQQCHPANRNAVAMELEQAKRHEGSTVFDWLVEIIEAHCEGGDEEEDGVELRLE